MSHKKIEIHVLHNFAPSCLNRDGTNTPKTAFFGGVNRARISSQCIKRAMEDVEVFDELLEVDGAIRTGRLILDIASRVDGKSPDASPDSNTEKMVADIFKDGGIERKAGSEPGAEKSNTKILLYLSVESRDRIVKAIKDKRSEWMSGKKPAKDALTQELAEALAQSSTVPKIALFGRMLELKDTTPFGKKQLRVDAACQVAHPISTHRVENELDYFVAMDDLLPAAQAGAEMLGYTSFNSACYYRYAMIDYDQLSKNLGTNATVLAEKTVMAFLKAFALAVPGAKRATFASPTPPSLVVCVVRDKGAPISMANAFARPVDPRYYHDDLIGGSISELARYWHNVDKMYGTVAGTHVALSHDRSSENANELLGDLAAFDKGSLPKAIEATMAALKDSQPSEQGQ